MNYKDIYIYNIVYIYIYIYNTCIHISNIRVISYDIDLTD